MSSWRTSSRSVATGVGLLCKIRLLGVVLCVVAGGGRRSALSAPLLPLRGCAVFRSAERLRTTPWLPAACPLPAIALLSALACNQFGIFSAYDSKAIAVGGFALSWIPPKVGGDDVLLELVVR